MLRKGLPPKVCGACCWIWKMEPVAAGAGAVTFCGAPKTFCEGAVAGAKIFEACCWGTGSICDWKPPNTFPLG